MQNDLRIRESVSNIAVSITAHFSGIVIVVAGGLADQFGRMKLTYIGLVLNALMVSIAIISIIMTVAKRDQLEERPL